MEYQIHDTVIYGAHGVCQIVDVEKQGRGEQMEEYYKLKPVYDEKATIFVPKSSEKLVNKMRRVLSAEEIYQLIQSMPAEESIWIQDENARKERYKSILAAGDRKELIQLIKTLHMQRQSQSDRGKKLYKTDEKFMQEAEKMLYEEFAHVLDIELEQVVPFIVDQIEVQEKAEPSFG